MIRQTLLIVALATGVALAQAKSYEFDVAHSTIGFTVTHLTINEVPGSFKEFTGTFAWDEKNPANSKLEVVAKAASIDTANAKRDEHLKSPDFFDVAKTPDVKFTAKSFKAESGNQYTVSGDLSFHGVTKAVSFPITVTPEVTHPMSKQQVRGLKAIFTVKRTDFKLAEKFPMMVVGDEVSVKVVAEVSRKP
ncbi:MAG: YceI family protein [Spirochaetes bacterium]|nr:YceI family protein [Spirochaetota bacterium]